MDTRPLKYLQLVELTAEFCEARAQRDAERMRQLYAELDRRRSRRARNLAMNARLMLASWQNGRRAA